LINNDRDDVELILPEQNPPTLDIDQTKAL
jgi:hypothetical protein